MSLRELLEEQYRQQLDEALVSRDLKQFNDLRNRLIEFYLDDIPFHVLKGPRDHLDVWLLEEIGKDLYV